MKLYAIQRNVRLPKHAKIGEIKLVFNIIFQGNIEIVLPSFIKIFYLVHLIFITCLKIETNVTKLEEYKHDLKYYVLLLMVAT